MESSRVMCPHCDGWFFPEEGVSLDDCPVCGRTVEVKPAPAPGATCNDSLQVHVLPDFVESALGVVALSDFPSVESVLRHHISDLTRRLAEAEAFKARVMAWAKSGCYKERVCGNHKKGKCFTVDRACRSGFKEGTLDNWTPPSAWEVGK